MGIDMILRKWILSIQVRDKIPLKLQLLWTILSKLPTIHLAIARVENTVFRISAASELPLEDAMLLLKRYGYRNTSIDSAQEAKDTTILPPQFGDESVPQETRVVSILHRPKMR
jgi:hypothetical protein